MGHLGDFGNAREANDATFGYFGETIRVHPDLTDVALFELFSFSDITASTDDYAKIMEAMRDIAALLVHPDDAEIFWATAKANRQTMEDIGELTTRLLAALVDRPTMRPSDSSAGPLRTATSSADDSSSPAMQLLEGRPDLQVAVLRAARSA